MKLIVKMPPKKPPFIGILFPESFDAGKMNQDLVERHRYTLFKVVFEFHKRWCNIRLISEEHLILRFYNHVFYDDIEKLQVWLFLTKDSPPDKFNFSHLIIRDGKETVVKTNDKRKNFILSLSGYEARSTQELSLKIEDDEVKVSGRMQMIQEQEAKTSAR